MEENRLDYEELRKVAGGKTPSGFKDAAVIVKTTDYYRDKNQVHPKGRFVAGAEVWVTGFYTGREGNVFYVVSRNGNKEGYVPDGTVQHDPDA